ncbi:hypothetical protein [Gluconobacter cerinus]|uniref:hypothetical protein n=1 Tax=Gluconobacter cerinus TaxID=38307 RepID=UPI001C05D0A8|nr:hypothetical protein [Gluconobacter cerinus]
MMLPTLPPRPPNSTQHITERVKLFASGCQSLALAILGAGIVAPLFTGAAVPMWQRLAAALAAAAFEIAAWTLLGYIPNTEVTPTETEHDE